MVKKLGVIMDPIQSIHYEKDSTLAMLWEACARGYEIYYFEPNDLYCLNGDVLGLGKKLQVFHDNPAAFYEVSSPLPMLLTDLSVILMRKDPPFNIEYIYLTYFLEAVEKKGVLVLNRPSSLRDVNEKLFTLTFSDCCPSTIVSKNIGLLKEFFKKEQDIVCKPLDAMGGSSIVRLRFPDENASAIFEMLTQLESKTVMAQRYIPEIKRGDKRILMIDGEPIPYALARIPMAGELRGNLAAGGKGVAQALTPRDLLICEKVGPILREKGLYFVGLDVIGDYLTEVNVTSPTCIRELDQQAGLNISARLFDFIERKIRA